jgi:threonine synthase
MKYYSINRKSQDVDFKQATILGQAPDNGLYFPEYIPYWSKEFIDNLKHLSKEEIGFQIMKPYIGGSMPDDILRNIIKETLSFDIPLIKIDDNTYCLELFHGPTLAFKDLGARFLSRCLGYFAKEQEKKIIILVATSGDTGGAVADGFYEIPGTEVIILYPSGKVSEVQEKQLTGLGGNIHALEIEGDFDDCQRLVKIAFADKDLQSLGMLTSANSINISRWLSQQIYYALALSQWDHEIPPTISVPSGNFGNLCAGLLAKKSGLPVYKFIAGCNKNDVFTKYINTGDYFPTSSFQTISNAMDVGSPSNFIRILELFDGKYDELKKHIESYSITDDETKNSIKNVYNKHKLILDPHTAVAYAAIKKWQQSNPGNKGIILGTAHPLKFPKVVENITGEKISIPKHIEGIMERPKKSFKTQAEFEICKDILMNLFTA